MDKASLTPRALILALVLGAVAAVSEAENTSELRENAAWLTSAVPESAAAGPQAEESVDDFILSTMATHNVPGVSACVVKDGEILWTGAYGYANIAASRPVTPNTLFMLASISKTLTGLALMQLWENGAFELDDDVADYLPFQLRNPHHRQVPLTFRQILSHTSSLDDNWDVMFSTYYDGDSPWQLADYAYAYFDPDGVYYDADANFHSYEPGQLWDYCNHGFVLAGYLVQTISGLPFAQYCRDSVFEPLGMDETSWFVADLDTLHMAMPYHYNGGEYQELGHFSYADYPAGALRTSASQLGRHLIAFGQHGRIDDARVLDSATVDTITTNHYPYLYSTQGLTWFDNTVAGYDVWRHGGGDQGVSTIASICFEQQLGVVVLTNGEAAVATSLIERKLYEMSFDADGDGANDLMDNCPGIYNPDQADGDNDRVGDACDNCAGLSNRDQDDADRDEIGDACDPCTDTDGDGHGDPGYPANECEPDICAGFDDHVDSDGDGVPDGCDLCPGYDDFEDNDFDGIADSCDSCPGFDNGLDQDWDLIPDLCDNCPASHNHYQEDSDADGAGDVCDPCPYDALDDGDRDGFCADVDNCPAIANPGQEDTDNDGYGDVCCCLGRVGNTNGVGGDEPTVGDVSVLIDHLYISGVVLGCRLEADVNQSGGTAPQPEDITIGDISVLIDYLFITGPSLGLPDCL